MLAVLVVWAIVSLAGLPPLDAAVTPDQVESPLGIFAALGVVLYGYASFSYFRLWTRRRTRLLFAVAFAFALLAEALIVAIASLPTSWRLSWWEWHVLMAISFFTIAAAAVVGVVRGALQRALPRRDARGPARGDSVLFADLSGLHAVQRRRDGPEQVHAMLVAYFGELAPMITGEFEGEVQDFVGDQIFAIFNKRGDQPDHALTAAPAPRSSCSGAPRRSASTRNGRASAPRSTPARSSPASSATAATASTASSATPSTSARGSRARRRPAAS